MTPLAAVPDDRLTVLARKVRAEHEQATRLFESAVEHAKRCGDLLIEAQAVARHGEWLPFLKEARIPQRTAHRYMEVARKLANQANLPPTLTEVLESVEERKGREHRETMTKLSAEFDSVMNKRPSDRYGMVSSGDYEPWSQWLRKVAEHPGLAERAVDRRVREVREITRRLESHRTTEVAKALRAAADAIEAESPSE